MYDLATIRLAVGAHMDADPATVVSVLREMKAAGKGIIGMKILGQGDLRGRVDDALRYALSHREEAVEYALQFGRGLPNPRNLEGVENHNPAVAFLGELLNPRPARRDEPVLGSHEVAVQQDQRRDAEELQKKDHAPLSGARVLGGFSSSNWIYAAV